MYYILQISEDSGYTSTPLRAGPSEVDLFCDSDTDSEWETDDDDDSDFEYVPPEESDDEVNMLDSDDDLSDSDLNIDDLPDCDNLEDLIRLIGGNFILRSALLDEWNLS